MRTDHGCRACGMSDDLKIFPVYPLAFSDAVYNLNHVHQDGYEQVKI
jgi:hypothetical protein